MNPSPEPFGPPSGSGMLAVFASTVASPWAVRTTPSGSDCPLRRACASAPIEIMLDAMSSAKGSSSPGTAIESGAVDTPAARAP